MLKTMDKEEVMELLSRWEGVLKGATAEAGIAMEDLPEGYEFDNAEAADSLVWGMYHHEGVVVILTGRHTIGEQYMPYMVVTEVEKRPQSTGNGQGYAYQPCAKTGNPNMKKVVASIRERAQQIGRRKRRGTEEEQAKEGASADAARALGDIQVPDSIMVSYVPGKGDGDGTFHAYIPGITLTADKLRLVCDALR